MNASPYREGVIVNANIRTMDPMRPLAQAVSWRDGRIVDVGSEGEVCRHGTQGEVIDARGGTVTPGLIDSHTHPFWGAELSRGIDLQGVSCFADVLSKLGTEAASMRQAGKDWVFGWNLDYSALEGRDVHGRDFEQAVYGMPTVVIFHDLHTVVATPAALTLAGIDGSERFGDNSAVVCDHMGRPTGELREPSAYNLLYEAAPALTRIELQDLSNRVLAGFARTGLTGGVVMDGSLDTIDLLTAMESEGDLAVRLDLALWHSPDRDDAGLGKFVDHLSVRGRRWQTGLIKLFIDGVIETGTAWLYEPDSCGQSDKSFWVDRARFAEVVDAYANAGFVIATHAIGDRAVGETLDVYKSVGARAQNGAPHRIEHVETLTDRDLSRLSELGVTASMQPLQMQWRHEDSSDRWSTRLGSTRAARAYRTRDLLEQGVPLALGSDWPVVPFDPRLGMAWARLRRHPGKPDSAVFEPTQRLTGSEALHGYTTGAAAAIGDTTRGRIARGYAADFTCFADDPVDVSGDELVHLPILATLVEGKFTFRGEFI